MSNPQRTIFNYVYEKRRFIGADCLVRNERSFDEAFRSEYILFGV